MWLASLKRLALIIGIAVCILVTTVIVSSVVLSWLKAPGWAFLLAGLASGGITGLTMFKLNDIL